MNILEIYRFDYSMTDQMENERLSGPQAFHRDTKNTVI
jgi:hypothetical protein